MRYKFKKSCSTCRLRDHCYDHSTDIDPYHCCEHDHESYKPLDSIEYWLDSFDSSSATECFTAVNQLKEAIKK